MLYGSGEFDELEFGIQTGEKNTAWTRHHVRCDCASAEIARWRAHRRTRHGCLPKRTRNPMASRRGCRGQVAAARAERVPATETARNRGPARRGKTHREFSSPAVATGQDETPALIC